MHVGDLDPSRPGLEEFKVDEDASKPALVDGRRPHRPDLWTTAADGDNGRGVSGDIWAGSPGAESWSSGAPTGCATPAGTVIGRKPRSINFLAWWDGDPVRELLDGTHIDKYGTAGDTRLLTALRRALQQRHQVHPVAVRRHPRRLARGGRLADLRQHGAADLHAPRRRPTGGSSR